MRRIIYSVNRVVPIEAGRVNRTISPVNPHHTLRLDLERPISQAELSQIASGLREKHKLNAAIVSSGNLRTVVVKDGNRTFYIEPVSAHRLDISGSVTTKAGLKHFEIPPTVDYRLAQLVSQRERPRAVA